MSANLAESDNPSTYPVGERTEHFDHVEKQPGLGSPFRFQVWLRHGLLGPAWAAICGALASGSLVWSIEQLLRLALLVFLVDVIWGALWSAVAATDWATPLNRWQSWRHGTPVRILPYTASNGPAGRLAGTLGQLRSWWVELVRPTLGPTLVGLTLLLPLALVMAAVLGTLPFLATLAAISLLQFVFIRGGGEARPVPGLLALFEIALPWSAGHALFDNLSLASTLLALAYALSYAGELRLVQGRPGLARWNLGQVIAIVVLVALGQPVAAGIAGLLFLSQAVLQPGLFDSETEQVVPAAAVRFLRIAQLWLMAAMLVAAWGVGAVSAGG